MFIPFGFMAGAPAAAGGFDPTLGGSITPYFWYDFTDSATMTFSSANNIEAISSKGSNTGEIRDGGLTGFEPPTAETGYTQFYGDGLDGTNSKLSRRYATDGSGDGSGDIVFTRDHTHINFINPTFSGKTYGYEPFVSMKGYNYSGDLAPDELNPVFIGSYASNEVWVSTDTTNANANISSQFWNSSNYMVKYSFDGATPTGWQSWFTRVNTTPDTPAFEAGRTSTETNTRSVYQRYQNGSLYENFTIGGRARNNSTAAPEVKIVHSLVYDGLLTDDNIDDLIDEFNNAYPSLNLNSVSN